MSDTEPLILWPTETGNVRQLGAAQQAHHLPPNGSLTGLPTAFVTYDA